MKSHKLASSVNLYRLLIFLIFPLVQSSQICLLGQHPQSPLNGICDTDYAFILNASDEKKKPGLQ